MLLLAGAFLLLKVVGAQGQNSSRGCTRLQEGHNALLRLCGPDNPLAGWCSPAAAALQVAPVHLGMPPHPPETGCIGCLVMCEGGWVPKG
jgi:hypothetical protein